MPAKLMLDGIDLYLEQLWHNAMLVNWNTTLHNA